MRRLRYTLTAPPNGASSDAVEWGYAWLLTPDGDSKTYPAVIALHQTVMQGKNEPVGLETRPHDPTGMEYARHLAERGFIVLAPDVIAFGERAKDHTNAKYRSADDFFAAHPEGSVMRKMVFDASRAVDLLVMMPGVDPKQIGCIGHSHGGYGTLFAMLFDERIKAGVISCGFNTLRDDNRPSRWWELTALIPRLGYYADDLKQAPIDFHILLSLIAPRPLMISAGRKDAIFPNPKLLDATLDQVHGVYRLYDAETKLRTTVFDGPHDFPEASRDIAYAMLANELAPGR
jgi:dienelactone hydrolase